jgi:hypothetical protein
LGESRADICAHFPTFAGSLQSRVLDKGLRSPRDVDCGDVFVPMKLYAELCLCVFITLTKSTTFIKFSETLVASSSSECHFSRGQAYYYVTSSLLRDEGSNHRAQRVLEHELVTIYFAMQYSSHLEQNEPQHGEGQDEGSQ